MNLLKKISFVFIGALLLTACDKEDNVESNNEDDFSLVSKEYLNSVSQYYPEGDVVISSYSNSGGVSTATYSLVGQSKKDAALGILAAKSFGDGTTCSSAISCGKALKKCLDNGQDGTISNGSCATYCVTCSDSKDK